MISESNISSQPRSAVALGQTGERKRITRWIKGGYVGMIAGALFITVEMFLMEVSGRGSFWYPIRLSASIAMGNRAVANSVPFTFDIFFVGMLVHFVLSIWYAVVLGMLVRKLKQGPAIMAGAGFGLLLYVFHFYGLAGFYPWVASSRSWVVIVSHVIFGVAVAWIYGHLHVRQLMREAGLAPELR